MLSMLLKFKVIPTIGFAHHFRMEKYQQVYGLPNDRSVEIVYIKSGKITAELYGKKYVVEPKSIIVLYRHLPFRLYSSDGSPQTHCTVQLLGDFDMELVDEDKEIAFDTDKLLLPFVIPPCQENEELKKILYAIVSAISDEEGKKGLGTTLLATGLLARMDANFRTLFYAKKSMPTILAYRVKKYIAEHIHENIALTQIAEQVGKTPNYVNSVFKATTGISILQYINHEKVRILSELLLDKELTFKEACKNVGIEDISYGYRVFKKHLGIPPGEYIAGEKVFVMKSLEENERIMERLAEQNGERI